MSVPRLISTGSAVEMNANQYFITKTKIVFLFLFLKHLSLSFRLSCFRNRNNTASFYNAASG